ncbi:MAG: M48 family metallopeptidase [Verrucomicrobiales bacterium]|nr:M48 family metallopeptidase [Verrucomicrobiales bacterium]
MQINAWFLIIVLALFLFWKLDLFATLLNLKALTPEIPDSFREFVDEEVYETSQEYTKAKAVLGIGESIFSLVVLFTFWWLGGFGWLDNAVRGYEQGPIVTGLFFIGALLVAQQILSTPFDLYGTFGLEEKFGFNRSTLATWCMDRVKGAVLGVLIGAPLLAALLWIFQTVPVAWLWGWILTTAFSLALTYIAPTWIMPLFNKFEPLPEGELKTEIHSMAEKCEFPLKEVTVMDGSKRSAKSNAFFTGLGNNKRIALFDTLIENHTVAELVGVLAHEIGHFKKRHIVKSLVIGILTTGAMFFLLGLMMENRSLFDAFGVEKTSVYVSLVLFGILMSPINDLLSIAGNAMSRKHEFEADAYAAEVTGNPEAMANALRKLSKDNLSNLTPHPFYVLLNYTHPPVVERVKALGVQ